MSALPPAASAVTNLPLALAWMAKEPSLWGTNLNSSQPAAALRLAISGCAPPASAVTNLPFDFARSATNPLPWSTASNCSQPKALIRLAISGWVPLASDVTHRLSACASRLTGAAIGVVPAVLSSLSGEFGPALCTAPETAPPTTAAFTWAGVQSG